MIKNFLKLSLMMKKGLMVSNTPRPAVTESEVYEFVYRMRKDRHFRANAHLGRGSSRVAYDMGNGYVIKLPLEWYYKREERDLCYRRGLWQTRKEVEVWENVQDSREILEILNPIVLHGRVLDTIYTVTEKIETAEDLEYGGCADVLEVAREENAKNGAVFFHLFDDIADELKSRFNVSYGDLFDNIGNFGMTNDNRLVITDYGFCGWGEDRYNGKDYSEPRERTN